MAMVIDLSDSSASRELADWVDLALAGERIIVRRDGKDVAELKPVPDRTTRIKTVREVRESLLRREATVGLAIPDENFAEDLAEIRRQMNGEPGGVSWE